MNQKLLVFLVIATLNIGLLQAEFSRGDFETCFYSCRASFKTSAQSQTADFTPTTQKANTGTAPFNANDFYQKMYKYEQCVLGISSAQFKSYYANVDENEADYVAIKDAPESQTSYCAYFFSNIYDSTKMNQDELKTLAQNCFTSDSGCGQFLPGVSDSVENDGTAHYSDAFDSCLDNCVEQTAIEALLEYNNCQNLCTDTFDASQSGDTTAEQAQYQKYEDCKRTSSVCGQLQFLTMEDFAYKAIWTSCEEECQGIYSADDDSADNNQAARITYFGCINECPVPDASSFSRLDNTVELSSSSLQFSAVLLLVISSFLLC